MKRVLIITYYWPPSGGAGVQRWLKFCKYLPQFDVLPTVITVRPEDASYPVLDPSFELEVPKEVEVIRTKSTEPLQWFSKIFGSKKVPYSGFSNVETGGFFSKASRWVRGNFFVPDARKYWNSHAYQAACSVLDKGDIDCVITTGPPHSTHLVGHKLKHKYGVKWVADFRDPWTDIYYYKQFLHTSWARTKDARLEMRVLRMADQVLSVCPSNFEVLSKKDDALKNKMALISNGFDSSDFGRTTGSNSADEFVLAYMGTMASTYNLEPIIQALSQLEFNWKLEVAGVIAPDIMSVFEKYGLSENLDLKGYLPHAEALKMIQAADALLHVVPDVDGARMGTTGKLFEYIGSGVPILNFGHEDGDSARFIREAGSGETYDCADTSSIAAYLTSIKAGAFNGSTGMNKFDRKIITEKLVQTLFENR